MENKRQVSKDRGDSVSGEIISVTAKFGILFFFIDFKNIDSESAVWRKEIAYTL